jgi:hypothetical protein
LAGIRRGSKPTCLRRDTSDAPAVESKETFLPKMRKKSELPTKTCVVCGLPFAWRKKRARDWQNVTHCSDRCRSAAKPNSARPSA